MCRRFLLSIFVFFSLLLSFSPLHAQDIIRATSKATLLSRTPAEHAVAMKMMMLDGGVAFGKWIDACAVATGIPFLTQLAVGPWTWMRLLSAVFVLASSFFVAWLVARFIRRRTGELQSDSHQSWLDITFSALRKPLALILCLVGGYLSLALLIDRVQPMTTRLLLFNALTSATYAGRILILFWVLFRLIMGVEKRIRLWAEKRGGVLENVLLPTIGHALRFIVPIIALILLLPLMNLPEAWAGAMRKISAMLVVGGLSFLLIKAANLSEKALLRVHRLDVPDNLQARKIYTQVSVIRKLVVVMVTVLGTASILMLFDPLRQLGTSILASAGIAGIVLGFAAQRTLGNFLAGIQIALSQPIRIDDVVIVENEWGRIEEINLTYVVVRIWDLRRLVVPITYFVEKPFQNWTRTSANLLGAVFLYLDYDVPVEEVRRELTRVCEENRENGLWDGEVCGLQVTNTKDSVLELRCLASSPDAAKSFDLSCILREKLIAFVRENYPSSLPRTRAEIQQVAPPKNLRQGASGKRKRPPSSAIISKLPGAKPISRTPAKKTFAALDPKVRRRAR